MRTWRRPLKLLKILFWLLLVAAGAVMVAPSIWRLAYPFSYPAAIERSARTNRLDPMLVAAVIHTESHFNPRIVSPRGAVGLMQIMPATGAWIAQRRGDPGYRTESLFDPATNIAMGTWYLAALSREFHGRLVPALAAYNAGDHRVQQWLARGVWSGSDRDLAAIPYRETRDFVARVMAAMRVYRRIYGPTPGRGG